MNRHRSFPFTLIRRVSLLAALLLGMPLCQAGDPLYRDASGQGIGWDPAQTTQVWLYGGDLPKITADQILTATRSAVEMWKSAPSSRLDLQFMGTRSGPVSPDQFLATFFNDPTDANPNDPIRHEIAIVPDADGKILEVVGSGLSREVYGLTWTVKTDSAPHIECGIVLLNGTTLDATMLPYTIRHEMGHALGLAHMEANIDCGQLVPPSDDMNCPDRPIMKRGGLGGGNTNPTLDDLATFAALYPDGSSDRAEIDGRLILRSTGATVPGALVVAREVGNPRRNAVSSVTSESILRLGQFVLAGLPPGDYRLEVSPLLSFPSESDAVGDAVSPFPALKTPSAFFASAGGVETPLGEYRLHAEAGKSYSVDLIQDDLQPLSPKKPKILDAGAIYRDNLLYVELIADNPNGEPLAVWEKRFDASGAAINPGAWLWDEGNSLGVSQPILQLSIPSASASKLSETRTVQLYLGGTLWYGDLDSTLPGVPASDLLTLSVETNHPAGDTDGDGKLTIQDVVLALKLVTGQANLPLLRRMEADVSPDPGTGGRVYGDGKIEITDVIALLRRLIGLDGASLSSVALLRSFETNPSLEGYAGSVTERFVRRNGGSFILP